MKFIIYGYMRSGTTMLTTMLNSHSQLKCYAEESVDVLPTLNDKEGINVKYPHLRRGEIINYVNDYKIIHLVRKNIFNTAMSNYMNNRKEETKTPTAHIFSTDEIEKDNIYYLTREDKHISQFPKSKREFHKDINKDKINVHRRAMVDEMASIKKQIDDQNRFLENNKNVLSLTYEELTQNDKDIKDLDSNISSKICDFLEVDFEDMYPTTMKVNDSRYEKYVSNWDEIKDLNEMIMFQWWEN